MLIHEVADLGGPCPTNADITTLLSQQESLLKKKNSLKTQLKYYKLVVRAKVDRNLFSFSRNKKQMTCLELEHNLKKVLSSFMEKKHHLRQLLVPLRKRNLLDSLLKQIKIERCVLNVGDFVAVAFEDR